MHRLIKLAASARCHEQGRRTAPSASTSASSSPGRAIQRHLGQRMATKAARGQISAADAPISKIWFSELNLEIAETALALLGARSMLVEGDELSEEDGRWQDSFLYARAWTIAGGTNEIMRNMIAERGLGLTQRAQGQGMTSTHKHTHPHTNGHARGAAAANDPFPEVEKVQPGLWSIPVPLPQNSLRYVLVYLFETDRGPYLVDAGWNTDDAFGALSAGMKVAGCEVSEVQGVMVTHIHPDHYGLAGRIRDASGRVDLAASRRCRTDPRPLRRARRPPRAGGGGPAPDGRARRGARIAAQRRHAGATLGGPGRARRPPRRRPEARGAGLGPDRYLDARPLARPPLLLRGAAPAHALG